MVDCGMAGSEDFIYEHFVVDGIVFPPHINQQRMDELKDFKLRPQDLFIVTYPKSGTTWAQQIVKLIANDGKDDDTIVTESIPWLEREFGKVLPSGVKVDEMPSPRCFKSHTPYHMMPGGVPHTSPAKYIYVARNPKDAAVSLYFHTRRSLIYQYTGPWDHFLQLFTRGRVESGLWFDHVLEWWKHEDDPNVLFLKYEDMQKDLLGAVRTIAEFMCCELKQEILEEIAKQSTFESMKANASTNFSWRSDRYRVGETQFMRKGEVGDWRNHFTAEQTAEFDVQYAERMKGSGLGFDFGY